jgi:hypothetical protein
MANIAIIEFDWAWQVCGGARLGGARLGKVWALRRIPEEKGAVGRAELRLGEVRLGVARPGTARFGTVRQGPQWGIIRNYRV